MRKSKDLLDLFLIPSGALHAGTVLFILRKNGRGDGMSIAAVFFFCKPDGTAVVFSIPAEGICRFPPPTSASRRKRLL